MGSEDRVVTIRFSDPDATESDTDYDSDGIPICKRKRYSKTFVIPKSIASQSQSQNQNQNQIDEDEAEEEAPPQIYQDRSSDEGYEPEASEDAMETDEEEEPGNVIDAPQFSDGSSGVTEANEDEPGNVINAPPQFSDGSEVMSD